MSQVSYIYMQIYTQTIIINYNLSKLFVKLEQVENSDSMKKLFGSYLMN